MLFLKLPPFFPCRVGEGKRAAISKQTCFSQNRVRSYIVLALVNLEIASYHFFEETLACKRPFTPVRTSRAWSSPLCAFISALKSKKRNNINERPHYPLLKGVIYYQFVGYRPIVFPFFALSGFPFVDLVLWKKAKINVVILSRSNQNKGVLKMRWFPLVYNFSFHALFGFRLGHILLI